MGAGLMVASIQIPRVRGEPGGPGRELAQGRATREAPTVGTPSGAVWPGLLPSPQTTGATSAAWESHRQVTPTWRSCSVGRAWHSPWARWL